jgi:hypothetical protein
VQCRLLLSVPQLSIAPELKPKKKKKNNYDAFLTHADNFWSDRRSINGIEYQENI